MTRDLEKGLAAKAHGQQLALDHAVPWKDEARLAIEWLAENRAAFTSEDLTERVGLPTDDTGMNKNNAVGAAMTTAAKQGIIVKIGYAPSQRPSSHGAILTVWRGAAR